MFLKKKHRLRNWILSLNIGCLFCLIAYQGLARYRGVIEAKFDILRGHHTLLVYSFLHFPDREDEVLRKYFGFKYSVVGCCARNFCQLGVIH